MELGEYISMYRKEAGLTIDDLASRSGVPKGTINKIIAGTTKSPTLETVQSLAFALGKTLSDFTEPSITAKKAPSLSDEAMKIAKDYSALDRWGKQAVRELIGTEAARMEDESRLMQDFSLQEEPKVIPLYWSAPAAGIAAPILGEDYDLYELKPEDPQGAIFAVKVSGNSMEPHFKDGSIAFCNKDPLRDGDIGVFYIDGGSVIKQYHYENFMGGMTYLFSLNRKRQDADIVISSTSGRTLTCLGRVITKKRYPVPGRG